MSLQKKSATIFIFLSLFCLSSCQRWVGNLLPARADKEMKFSDRDGLSVEFKQGWDDGCEAGMASGSNTFYQMFYRNNKADGYKMTSSADYKTAWGNAFWFCYRTDWVRQKSSIWGSIFGGYR
jgi:hypothetical protein